MKTRGPVIKMKETHKVPSVRDEFEIAVEELDVERRQKWLIVGEESLLEIEKFFMEFSIGKEIALVRIETPNSSSYMMCETLQTTGSLGVELQGFHEYENASIFL